MVLLFLNRYESLPVFLKSLKYFSDFTWAATIVDPYIMIWFTKKIKEFKHDYSHLIRNSEYMFW